MVKLNSADGWLRPDNLDASFDGLIKNVDSKMSKNGLSRVGSSQSGYLLVLGCKMSGTNIDVRIKTSAPGAKIVLTHKNHIYTTRYSSNSGVYWNSTLSTRTPKKKVRMTPGWFNFSGNKHGAKTGRIGVRLNPNGLINIFEHE